MGQEVFPFGLINEYDSSERLVRSGIAQDPKKRLQFIPRINILAWDDFGLGGKEQGVGPAVQKEPPPHGAD